MVRLRHPLLFDGCARFTAPAVGESPTIALGVDETIDLLAGHAHAADQSLGITVPVSELGAPVGVEPFKMSEVFHRV